MKEWLTGIFITIFNHLHQLVASIVTNPNLSFGLTIILFTILIKIVLLPLTIKQTKASVKLSEIGPKAQAIQSKYKNDPQRAQMEVMKLYKEENVNPMSGCLPLIIQMPILFALFYAFSKFDYQNAAFLWLPNLSAKDPYYILPILSGITTYIASKALQPAADNEMAKKTSSMNIVMAIVFGFMSINMQSSIVLYWTINNIIQLVQTKLLTKKDIKELKIEEAKEAKNINSNNSKNTKNDKNNKNKNNK